MNDVVICEPLRTPVGRFGGVLKDIAPDIKEAPPVPPETTNAWVNDWNAWMICSTRLKKMIGESSGRVILLNWAHRLAPSTLAAS